MDTKSLAEIILPHLKEATKKQPVSVNELAIHVARTRLNGWTYERQIKAAIKHLRSQGHIIIARRGQPCGYYIDASTDGARAAAWCLIQQAASMLETAREMVPKQTYLELAGQARLEAA